MAKYSCLFSMVLLLAGCGTRHQLTLEPHTSGRDICLTSFHPTSGADVTYLHALSWTVSGAPIQSNFLIDFDLSLIPEKATIKKAELTLYADTTTVYFGGAGIKTGHSRLSGSNSGVLKRIIEPWSESTITWNNQPATDMVNAIELHASHSRHESYVIDVRQLIEQKYENPGSYHGFLIELNNDNPYRSLVFYSGDCQYPGLRPKLFIEYKK